jgi:hypothetical protein
MVMSPAGTETNNELAKAKSKYSRPLAVASSQSSAVHYRSPLSTEAADRVPNVGSR